MPSRRARDRDSGRRDPQQPGERGGDGPVGAPEHGDQGRGEQPAHDDHGETDRAVVDGIAHTGRLVTSAALILFLAFVALSTVPAVEVKILATTLALGILIDAVVVRGLLAPALVGVLGPLNWTMPRLLRRVLRVREPATPSSC